MIEEAAVRLHWVLSFYVYIGDISWEKSVSLGFTVKRRETALRRAKEIWEFDIIPIAYRLGVHVSTPTVNLREFILEEEERQRKHPNPLVNARIDYKNTDLGKLMRQFSSAALGVGGEHYRRKRSI